MRSAKNFLLVILLISGLLAHTSQPQAAASEPDIKDVVACNVYWDDFRTMGLRSPNLSKFVVTFGSSNSVDLIKSITVKGPDSYTFSISLQPFTYKNFNGYQNDNGNIWFMGFDKRGFLKDGRYDITLVYKSGRVTKKGRTLKYSNKILDTYFKHKPSFSPTGKLPAGTDLSKVYVKWSVLPECKAYYMARVGTYVNTDPTITKRLKWIFEDTILGTGTGNPENTGLNKNRFLVNGTLQSGQWYIWFTEILDSNDLNKINIAIFCRPQNFITPAK